MVTRKTGPRSSGQFSPVRAIWTCLYFLYKSVFSRVHWLETWRCPHLLLSAVRPPRATAALLRRSCSSAAAMGQTDGQTERRTDTVPSYIDRLQTAAQDTAFQPLVWSPTVLLLFLSCVTLSLVLFFFCCWVLLKLFWLHGTIIIFVHNNNNDNNDNDSPFWFSGTMPSYFMTVLWRRRRSKIRYDRRCYFNVRSKADISQLNLPHWTDN